MEIIDNINKTLKSDLVVELKKGSKVSIAASCFSIYAFEELKSQLKDVEELRFIFTSPTFVTEKANKQKREFYIPRLNRERNLYGSEFEIKLRNELSQKAIAKECAEWIRKKVEFKSNVDSKSIQNFINVVNNTNNITYTNITEFSSVGLGYEKDDSIFMPVIKLDNNVKCLLDNGGDFAFSFNIDTCKKVLLSKFSKQKVSLGTRVSTKVTRVDIPQKEEYVDVKEIIKDNNKHNVKKLEKKNNL
jgi:hypothetical protein